MNSMDKMDCDRLIADNMQHKRNMSSALTAYDRVALENSKLAAENESLKQRETQYIRDAVALVMQIDALKAELQALRDQEPVAWLWDCRKGGLRTTYATVDPNDTTHWPTDQWLSISTLPLYTSAPPAPIPEGWQLVPMDPTVEMREAMRCGLGGSFLHTKQVYKAMLAASPKGE